MRAPTASTNELVGILGVAAFIGAVVLYMQTPAVKEQPLLVVAPLHTPVPPVIVKPAQWGQGGVGPGWSSGRWLGEGDFKHFGSMDHPFRDQPRYSGHPMHMPALERAPRIPPRH